MLSIARLRVGQEAYTLAGVAQSLNDYYTGRGEADGLWVGTGARRLGLDGLVDADDLRAVLAGLAPGTGGLTPNGETLRTHPRRVPGFDLTFKAPKSVSVLYAVTDDPRVQGQIIEAGEAAVRQTIGWLEREAIRVRRGSGDAAYLNDLAARDPEAADAAKVRVLPGRGVVAAMFRHRTSRAGDPLLHWHTLVANLVEGPDGRWGAFVHPELYRSVRAAGELFQTALRHELTERLGVEWRPGRHVPEVAGVPQAVCDGFSKRATEIDAWLAATGTPDDVAGRQAAVLATRKGKPEVEGERFDAAWKLEAAAAGWGPAEVEALLTSAAGRSVGFDSVWRKAVQDPVSGATIDVVVPVENWISGLGRALTTQDTTFTRPQLFEAVAGRIGDGATVPTVERIVARVLASTQVVPIADGTTPRWTTTAMLEIEQRFLTAAKSTRNSRATLDPTLIDTTLANTPSLGTDQEQAVRIVTGAADSVVVLVGPAGTGKTYTLDAVRRVFDAAGLRVIGVAPSARAAHELSEGAHIPSATIHRQLAAWDRGIDIPDRHTVLVVDEAAMAGIRELEQVTRPVINAGGRVVLVGDHHQLPEVTAGGGFAALANDPDVTVAELSMNRRQQLVWERTALAALRNGRVADAVAAYREHDRIVIVDNPADLIGAAVARWLDAHHHGHVPVLLAGTNSTVDALNDAVRRKLIDTGVITPVNDQWATGDRVVMRINDYHTTDIDGRPTAVLNGHTGTLEAINDTGLVVRLDHDDAVVRLDPTFVAAGGVTHAYATTAHRAQGGTWDLAIAVGFDGLYREAGYLVMSRGRQSNWLVVTQPDLHTLDTEIGRHDSPLPLPVEEPDPIDVLVRNRLTVSRAKALATISDPAAADIHTKSMTLDLPTLERWASHARAAEAHATQRTGTDPRLISDQLDRLEHTARHLAVGQRVKAWDRRNIGTVAAIEDTAGTARVEFISATGATAQRTLQWADVTIVDPPHPPTRELSQQAASMLDNLSTELGERLDRWHQHLAAAGVEPGDAHTFQSAATLAIDRAAATLHAAAPRWLTSSLGERPTDNPAATQVWDDAVRQIATHRLRLGITDPVQRTPLPEEGTLDRSGNAIEETIATAREWLDVAGSVTEAPRPERTVPELQQRQRELETILSTAPVDVRDLFTDARLSDMLPFDDVDSLVADLTRTRRDRQQWVLEHWPEVVESIEVANALSQTASPVIDGLDI